MSSIITGIAKDLKAIPKNLKEKAGGMDTKKLVLLNPRDLLIGAGCGVALRLVVYFKAKIAKKFRHGVEYGSARWLAHHNLIQCTQA